MFHSGGYCPDRIICTSASVEYQILPDKDPPIRAIRGIADPACVRQMICSTRAVTTPKSSSNVTGRSGVLKGIDENWRLIDARLSYPRSPHLCDESWPRVAERAGTGSDPTGITLPSDMGAPPAFYPLCGSAVQSTQKIITSHEHMNDPPGRLQVFP